MLLKTGRVVLLNIVLVSIVATGLQWQAIRHTYPLPTGLTEDFDPEFARFNSVDKIIVHLDSLAEAQQFSPYDSREYVDHLDTLLRNRFFHGYSQHGLADDYISYLLGKYVWFDLSASVDPEFIISHNMAACSQQSIVFMEVLRRKGYTVRKVGLVGHFCTGVFYNDDWHFYDTNMEPRFAKGEPIPGTAQLLQNKPLLYAAYQHIMTPGQIDRMFAQPTFEIIDELPGKNIRRFHRITRFLSNYLWLICLGLYGALSPGCLLFFKQYVWNIRLLLRPADVYGE